MTAIVARGLVKRFGGVAAVDGVSFRVEAGEVFGFLGPNGAGKSTTIRILTGVLRPDAGSAAIGGHDVRAEVEAAKSEIGIVPERFTAYPDLSAWRNLMLAGELYGVPRDTCRRRGEDLLRTFGLLDRRDAKAKTYSKGMRQRLMLAMALLHDPSVLFLDEPITGLDVASQQLIREEIQGINRAGRTVFLTTHDIAEADRLCDRVAIIDRGRIAATDTPEALKETIDRTRAVEVRFDGDPATAELAALAGAEGVERRGNLYRIHTPDPDRVVKGVAALAARADRRILSLNTRGPSLEDAFTRLTGAGR